MSHQNASSEQHSGTGKSVLCSNLVIEWQQPCTLDASPTACENCRLSGPADINEPVDITISKFSSEFCCMGSQHRPQPTSSRRQAVLQCLLPSQHSHMGCACLKTGIAEAPSSLSA